MIPNEVKVSSKDNSGSLLSSVKNAVGVVMKPRSQSRSHSNKDSSVLIDVDKDAQHTAAVTPRGSIVTAFNNSNKPQLYSGKNSRKNSSQWNNPSAGGGGSEKTPTGPAYPGTLPAIQSGD